MFRTSCLMVVFGCAALFAANSNVTLSGTVKDATGTAVAGAEVSLQRLTSAPKDTTDAEGAFSIISTSVAVPSAVLKQEMLKLSLKGNAIQFTTSFKVDNGTISIFSGNGRLAGSIQLNNLKPGVYNKTLPQLAPGSYVMNITLDQVTVARRLINTGSGMCLSSSNETGVLRNVTTTANATAAVDSLIVAKNGYETATIDIDSYEKTGIAIVLKSSGSINPTCETPLATLPSSSQLTKENTKLPDPFTFFDGTKLTKKSQWECRRQEILAMASKYIYGPCPPKPDEVTGTVSGGTVTINCKVGSKSATFSATISGSGDAIAFDLSSGILPASCKKLSLGSGNDSKIKTLYGLSEINPNLANAWMVDRVMDVLELNPNSGHDPQKMIVSGCSGCGKGAYLVGAYSRIPLTVIVESGGGGAANLRMTEWFRHGDGSKIYKCSDKPQGIDNLEDNGICGPWVTSAASWLRSSPAKVKLLPFDQHMLLACIAPRYLCHVTNQHGQSEWCHLGGTCEALSAWAAEPVWNALGVPERMGFLMYTEGSAPGHCSKPASATALAGEFFKRVFKDDNTAKTDVMTMNTSDLQQPQSQWKSMWVDWDMATKLE